MARQVITVKALAELSGFDIEDVIIELVRLGIEYAVDPRAIIRSGDYRKSFRAVGLNGPGEEQKKSYWHQRLSLSADGFEMLLKELNVPSRPEARMLPKGAHAKLSGRLGEMSVRETAPANPAAIRRSGEIVRVVEEPVDWRVIGQKRVTYFLDANEVARIHEELEADAELASDPIYPPGVRSRHLLESACTRPHTGQPHQAKYPTVEMSAAALVHSVVNNHPFHNGNKRTALVAMMVLLDRNNHWLRDTVKQADLYIWILEVARHRVLPDAVEYADRADREVLEMAEWIRRNSRAIERSERPIKWRDLRTILVRDFGCEIDTRSVRGRVTVKRKVRVSSRNPLRGFRKDVDKSYVVSPGADGREVGLGTVKALRQQLCLTEEYRIDSAIFYGAVSGPDEFIGKYQRLLRDLARV